MHQKKMDGLTDICLDALSPNLILYELFSFLEKKEKILRIPCEEYPSIRPIRPSVQYTIYIYKKKICILIY
jgi:hypothetical protein